MRRLALAIALLAGTILALWGFVSRERGRELATLTPEAAPEADPPATRPAIAGEPSSARRTSASEPTPTSTQALETPTPAGSFRVEVLDPTGRPFLGAPAFVFLASDEEGRARLRALAADFDAAAAFDLNRAWKGEDAPRAGFADERFAAPSGSALLLVAARDGAGLAGVELAPPVPELVRVRLAAERQVTVRVLDVEGRALPEVWCILKTRAADAESGRGPSHSAASSDAEGRVVLALPAGAVEALEADERFEVWTHLPPNRSAAVEVPRAALEDERVVDFVLPPFGAVELRTRERPGGPARLGLQLQELRPGVDPGAEGSMIHVVRPGAGFVFERVPLGLELLAVASPWGGRGGAEASVHIHGPAVHGERVVVTVP